MNDADKQFSVGEDVMYQGERYTVAEVLDNPHRLRLIAVKEPGSAFVYASPEELEGMMDEDSNLKTQL